MIPLVIVAMHKGRDLTVQVIRSCPKVNAADAVPPHAPHRSTQSPDPNLLLSRKLPASLAPDILDHGLRLLLIPDAHGVSFR